MDSPHSSVVEKENNLEQALRTYEESERSLKSICSNVEHENRDLENQLKQLETYKTSLIKQLNSLKQRFQTIENEHQTLNEKQIYINQQTKLICQRYEQIRSALKTIVYLSTEIDEGKCEKDFSSLGFKIVPIDEKKTIKINVGTDYDPPCLSSKRKFNDQDRQINFNSKHSKNHSHLQRSSK